VRTKENIGSNEILAEKNILHIYDLSYLSFGITVTKLIPWKFLLLNGKCRMTVYF